LAYHNLAIIAGPAQVSINQPIASESTLNFGLLSLGSTNELTLTISNDGLVTLANLTVNITGSEAFEFQSIALGTTTLASGSSTSLTVAFDPSQLGLQTATLAVTSGAPGAQPYDIELLGAGTSSQSFTVTPGAGADGSISPDTPQTVSGGESAGFTATPSAGYVVSQWLVSGSVAQNGGDAFILSNIGANASVQVTFAQEQTFTVTPGAGVNGSINPPIAQNVTAGDSVYFTATPSTGYVVSQWLVSGSVAQTGGNAFTLDDVTGNALVQVTFALSSTNAFYFAEASAQVTGTDGGVTLTVSRNFTAAATVDYQTANDTAIAGVNYTAVEGTLNFAANQLQQTIYVPVMQVDSAPGSTFFTLQLSNPGGGATVGTPGSAGIYILNPLAGDLTLSQTSMTLPQSVPAGGGSITVDLTPPAAGGEWRLFGELNWRGSGATAAGLTSGNYEIEFKTADGYQQPAMQVVPLTAGQQVALTGTYMVNGSLATGSLQVTMAPEGIGGWRIQGETAWRANGATVANLNTGDYIIEFEPEPASGLVTPENCEAEVVANEIGTISTTYTVGDSTQGLPPALVSETVAQTEPPYVFTGQIQTDQGFGTGFVPLDRVVLTAAHVIFDDSTLSYVQGVRWFPQYEAGAFETPAQVPVGSYVLDGYAQQRALDNSPGAASDASRELDAAALYFFNLAAFGGASGYLASDSTANSWLTGGRDKFIAGYPVSGVASPGQLYATPIVQDPFQYVDGSVFSTDAITSYPGNSGGPLFVRFDDGNFYPAAIYLGGSQQTEVRAIDSQVIALMKEAEKSGDGGANNLGGGVVEVSEGLSGALAFALGELNVKIVPAGAVAHGAYWEFAGDDTKYYSGQTVPGLAPGPYTLEFFAGDGGYTPPDNAQVTVTTGARGLVTATYTINQPIITSTTTATAILGQPFHYQLAVTPSASLYMLLGTLPSGLALNGTTGLISGVVSPTAEADATGVSFAAENEAGVGPTFTLNLTVAQPGTLTVSVAGNGKISSAFVNPPAQAVGSSVSITASPAAGSLFEDWSDADTGQVLSTQRTYTFTMPSMLDLEANFVQNPFLAGKGSYMALLQGDSLADSGFAQLTVAANGNFTATVNLGGNSFKVRNAFSLFGDYLGQLSPPGGGSFDAALSVGTGAILTGTLTDRSDGAQMAVYAERAQPHADEALAGTYTVELPAASGTALPGGNGYGTLTVSKTGAVKFSGKLGDGAPVAISGALDSSGAWPFLYYRPMSNNAGAELLLGSVSFSPTGSGAAGTLNWYRMPDGTYPLGFSMEIPFVAVRYAAPAVTYQSANVIFSGADIGTAIEEPVTIAPNGKVTASGALPFKLTFAQKTGLFSGSFMDNGSLLPFSGAVLQSGSNGFGVFQDAAGDTGSVLLEPGQ
jgi:hypothetical protein